MPVLAFVGDTHGKIRAMYDYLLAWEQRTGAKLDAVVQVGDFGIFLDPKIGTDFPDYWNGKAEAPILTAVCPGNHEDIRIITRWLLEDHNRVPNIRLLPNGEVGVIDGVRIGAIWGNYSPKSWEHPERIEQSRMQGHWGRIANHVYRPAVERLAKLGPIDVLVTHDSAQATLPARFRAPMPEALRGQLGIDADEKTGGCPGFDLLIHALNPRRYFFGHLHGRVEMRYGQTICIGLNAFDWFPGEAVEIVEF